MIKIVEKVMDRYYSEGNPERLSPSAYMVLMTLARECTGMFGFSQVSMRRMKALTRLGSTNTIRRAFRELEAKEFVLPLKSELDKCSPRLYILLPENKDTKEKNLSKAAEPQPLNVDPHHGARNPPNLDALQAPDLDDLMKEIEEILGGEIKL